MRNSEPRVSGGVLTLPSVSDKMIDNVTVYNGTLNLRAVNTYLGHLDLEAGTIKDDCAQLPAFPPNISHDPRDGIGRWPGQCLVAAQICRRSEAEPYLGDEFVCMR